MAFEKITNEDTQNKGVVGLADTPGFSASEMQNKFEELSKEVIIPKFNKLVDELNENDVDKAVSSPDITNVRLSSDNTIQVSTNHGISFEETASSGHIIADFQDETFPQRSRMRFSDNVRVYDNPDAKTTEIIIANGEKGDPAIVNGKRGAEINIYGSDIELVGYTKPAVTSPIASNDTVNVALGKLETANDDAVERIETAERRIEKTIEIVSFDASTGTLVTRTME